MIKKITKRNIVKLICKFWIAIIEEFNYIMNFLKNPKYQSLSLPEKNLERLLNDQRFYDSLFKDYLVDGINFQIKYLAHEEHRDFIENEAYKVVDSVVTAICEGLPFEIKSILRHKKATICLRDIKSLRQLRSCTSTLGIYRPNSNTIEIGLCDANETINTLYHEIGHFIDNSIKNKYLSDITRKSYYSETDKETAKAFEEESHLFGSYAETNKAEYIAVAFEKYFTNSKRLDKAPLTKKLLDGYMKRVRTLYRDCISDELYNTEFKKEQHIIHEIA